MKQSNKIGGIIDIREIQFRNDFIVEACRLLVGLAKYDANGQLIGFCQNSEEVYNYITESLTKRKELQANETK